MCMLVSILCQIRFSPCRWGSRRRCCTCLCSLRGPSLRPAARTPHHPRPNAGSHCWRRSRNSDRHPERWHWLLPVTHRGHTHWQLEHGRNWTNTCKCHRHLLNNSRKLKLQLPNLLFYHILFFQDESWSIVKSNETLMCMTSPPHSCWINRWMGLWPVTPEVDWEHCHSASYWSAAAGARGNGPRMEIWLRCGDKRTHWGQQVVYGGN